jgi:hypothetical protein
VPYRDWGFLVLRGWRVGHDALVWLVSWHNPHDFVQSPDRVVAHGVAVVACDVASVTAWWSATAATTTASRRGRAQKGEIGVEPRSKKKDIEHRLRTRALHVWPVYRSI